MTIKRNIEGKQHVIELTDEEVRQASEQYDNDCRTEDILDKIKEKFAEPLESLGWFDFNNEIAEKIVLEDGHKTQKAAEGMVWSVDRALGRNDTYWECFWNSVQYVVDEELDGIPYEESQITIESQDGHIYVMADGKTMANISPEEVKIFDFDFFADSGNRDILSGKLDALNMDG